MEDISRRINFFEGLTNEVVEKFTRDLHRIRIPQGQAIIAEHTRGDNLFLICRGKIEISKVLDSRDTPNARLSVLEPGDFFGEMSIIDNEPRSANALALEDVELLVIDKESFTHLVFEYPVVMFNLIRTMSHRLRSTNEKFIELMSDMISKNRLMAIGMAAGKIIHDIKSPLTVIVLTAQILENLFPNGAEFTESIIKQTKMIDQMVREILDFARGQESPPVIQRVDLEHLLRDLKETYGHTLKSRNIEFKINNQVREAVYFDENKIRRVILNLLKNASEAIADAGSIQINATLQAGWLQISIVDDGSGIPEHLHERLFEPFVTEGKSHGTGLGLAICRKIVNEHKGRLEFQPNQPQGTRFDIRIPQFQD